MRREPPSPLVSIVIPVVADDEAAARLLGQIPPDPRVEVVIADGQGDLRLSGAASERPDVTVLRTPRGRAVQMNAGAAVARGAWLLFLHADSILPDGWLDGFVNVAAGGPTHGNPAHAGRSGQAGHYVQYVGGWFRFALDDPAWQARMIERGVRWRVRRLRLPYGDQGLFAARTVFDALGGYREMPLLEDVDLVRRLLKAGPVVELPLTLTTSARRWRSEGWLRRSARNLVLITLYFAGVSPERLARWSGPPTSSTTLRAG